MKQVLLLSLLLISLFSFSQTRDWLTPYEKSGGTQTPRYKETMDFCTRMAASSKWVKVKSFGLSAQGRALPVLVIDKEGLSTPGEIHRSGKVILLVQACIHPGESEGKDAGMMMIRDIVIEKKFPGLLDHISVLFIPIFNIDGHERFGPYNRINQNGPKEMGWRVTANNLNLNRDYLKADTPEMQAWLRMFNEWMPDFFIDIHTTDGADYQYVLTYQMEIFGNMDPGLTAWCKEKFIPEMTGTMEKDGIPVFPYVDFRNWHDPKSGLETGVSPPMLSQSYTSMRNRPGLLIETHMLKPYNQRVYSVYECLMNSMEILNREYLTLLSTIKKADVYTSGTEFREKDFPLRYETIQTDSTMVDFLGIRYEEVTSEITGQTWFKYGKEKVTFRLPYFNKTRPVVTTKLPEAYIIPVEWKTIIDRLEVHGILFKRLTRDTVISITTCKFTNPKWQQNPYEGRHPLTNIEIEEITENRKFISGSAVVDMKQPSAKIIASILEPKASGSYVYWGFFDAVFEQKEYSENYVMEAMIPKIMADDPGLKEEFEKKKRDDPAFAKNPNLILNWFYSKTPYWDDRKDIYPVGKIFDREVTDRLK